MMKLNSSRVTKAVMERNDTRVSPKNMPMSAPSSNGSGVGGAIGHGKKGVVFAGSSVRFMEPKFGTEDRRMFSISALLVLGWSLRFLHSRQGGSSRDMARSPKEQQCGFTTQFPSMNFQQASWRSCVVPAEK